MYVCMYPQIAAASNIERFNKNVFYLLFFIYLLLITIQLQITITNEQHRLCSRYSVTDQSLQWELNPQPLH